MNNSAIERWNVGFTTSEEEYRKEKIANVLIFIAVSMFLFYLVNKVL